MNQSILLFFNSFVHRSMVLDDLGIFLIQGSLFIVPLIVLAVYVLGIVRKNERWRTGAVTAGVFVVACVVIAELLGLVIHEPRPLFVLASQVKVLLPHANDSSFPSGHTTLCFSAAFGLYLLDKRFGIVMMVFGLLVGFAKIFAAHHYPLDIVGTILLIFVLFLLYRAFVTKWVEKTYLALEHRVLPSLS
ncbi:MAG: phosphatase PAP2 family protein [Coriobacteriia bacterium]|nr:phosphatase PAP2 family protein [Coriobacteriia bacterium]